MSNQKKDVQGNPSQKEPKDVEQKVEQTTKQTQLNEQRTTVAEVIEKYFPDKVNAPIDEQIYLLALQNRELSDYVRMLERSLSDILAYLKELPLISEIIDALNNGATIDEAVALATKDVAYDVPTQQLFEFAANRDLSEEQYNKLESLVTRLSQCAATNTFDSELLDSISKICFYDQSIEQAFNNGVIEGRNQRIEEIMREAQNSDGLFNAGATVERSREQGYIERILKSRK